MVRWHLRFVEWMTRNFPPACGLRLIEQADKVDFWGILYRKGLDAFGNELAGRGGNVKDIGQDNIPTFIEKKMCCFFWKEYKTLQ
ncbi:MAG: hypothetical protein HYZ34_00030 [Ignavibacteriae bacterium]|nr:hypothetical protein [Ignavibacteriota bacterium]